jgi:hypothetical protein
LGFFSFLRIFVATTFLLKIVVNRLITVARMNNIANTPPKLPEAVQAVPEVPASFSEFTFGAGEDEGMFFLEGALYQQPHTNTLVMRKPG